MSFTYWAIIGTLYLIILTYQDLRHNRLVDERHNYFMGGITFSLISHLTIKWWLILIIFLTVTFTVFMMGKFKFFGTADIQTFLWTFTGFSLLGWGYLLKYGICLLGFTGFYMGLKKLTIKSNGEAPYYPVILGSFFMACFWAGLFIK